MRHILSRKLIHCLRVGDLPGFRRHFNLQTVYLRGLEIAPVAGLLPSCEGGDAVAEFLHQNGFRTVRSADSAGWRALHYAALAGNVEVLRGFGGILYYDHNKEPPKYSSIEPLKGTL